MSDFAALGAMVALGMANAFLFVFMDKWVKNRADTIANGGFQGVPVSLKRRRYMLQVDIVINSGTLIAVEGILAIAWLLIGGNASADDLKLLAYLMAFLDATGAIGWLATLPTHYRHLAAVLREAEAG
jgi:hypothetical protein